MLFAMSAFLLTLSYARSAIDGDDPQPAGTFLFRRAVRILPLYWVGVVTVWAVRNPTLHADWLDLFEHLTFTQIFDQQRIFYTLGPTWSMSLEIFFYALLVVLGPAAVRLCRRLPSRRQRVRVLLGGCGALFAIPVIWNAVAFLGFHVSYDHWPVYFGPQSRFGAFAVGMALAVFAASRRSEPLFRGVWPSVLRVAALGIVLGATALNRPGTYGQVAYHDIAALGWLLLLASTVLGERGQTWSRWLSWRPLTLAGLISYSTYMWHEPVMMLLGHVGLTSRSAAALPWSILTVLVVSVLVGAVADRFIEYPTGKLAGAPRAGRPVAQLLRADVHPEPLTPVSRSTAVRASGHESQRSRRSPASASSPSAASPEQGLERVQVEVGAWPGTGEEVPGAPGQQRQPDVARRSGPTSSVTLTPDELEACVGSARPT